MRSAPARVTTGIVLATTLAWALVMLAGLDRWAEMAGGFIPGRVGNLALDGPLPVWLTPLSATLVHAGVLHIVSNMLMLSFCGRLVEAAIGGWETALLYLIGAYAGALAQYLAGPHSLVPVVGASGAISAVIAAYALLYGQRRPMRKGVPAGLVNVLWLAATWIGLQLLLGIATSGTAMHLAIAEHVGGFLVGLLLARPLLLLRYRNA